MKKIKLMALCCLLSGLLVACGKQPESSDNVSVATTTEKTESAETVKDVTKAGDTEKTEAATTESEKKDNKISADEYYFDKCTSSYFMTESFLDDEIADKLSQTSVTNIRNTGSSVKFITMLCEFSGVFDTDITPKAVPANEEKNNYSTSSLLINQENEDGLKYFVCVVICPEEYSYNDFKMMWEAKENPDENYVAGTHTEDIILPDDSFNLDYKEEHNIFNLDGNYYAVCGDYHSMDSSVDDNGITTNYSGINMILLRGDSSAMDFSKFKITTTFDGAKELFEDMNYQVVDRFANKGWLATNDSHPVYDTVMFMGTFERRAAEAYYALLVQYAAETDYEGEKDLLITYTNDAGEEIWINQN